MKIIDRIILTIYSLIMLLESIIGILLIFGWLKVENLVAIIKNLLGNSTIYNILFGAMVVFIILSIKALLFSGNKKDREANDETPKSKQKEGVVVENESGKLVISKETIERIANNVVKTFDNIQDFKTKVMITQTNEIIMDIEVQIFQNTVIKDLNEYIQEKIKKAEKDATDLDIKEINIKVKNIIQIQEKNKEEEE